MDDSIRRKIRALGRVLAEAIADSSEAARTLREIRDEGYALYLLVDNQGEKLRSEPLSMAPQAASPRGPEFRIDGRDLSFLRSIGIDPTRRFRRRRS